MHIQVDSGGLKTEHMKWGGKGGDEVGGIGRVDLIKTHYMHV